MPDGRQDSKRLPASKQYEVSRHTILQLESKNHQATDWKTNYQIPRHDYIFLLQVFQRLRVRIEDELLPCFFLFGTFLAFVLGIILDCAFIWLVRAKNPPLLKAIIAF